MVDDTYREFMESDDWKIIRQEALELADFECERCGAPANHVHHISYENFGGWEEPEDLEALCEACHKEEHGLEEWEEFDDG